MRKREPSGQSTQDRKVQGTFRQCYVCREKARKIRWPSALNDLDFILQEKGNHQKSMVGFLF